MRKLFLVILALGNTSAFASEMIECKITCAAYSFDQKGNEKVLKESKKIKVVFLNDNLSIRELSSKLNSECKVADIKDCRGTSQGCKGGQYSEYAPEVEELLNSLALGQVKNIESTCLGISLR